MIYDYLQQNHIKKFIRSAIEEDIGPGDYSSLASIPSGAKSRAQLIFKSEGIVAGIELAKLIFAEIDTSLKLGIKSKDGDKVNFGDIIFTIEGKAQSILSAERLVLNCMQRMSGIATKTNKIVGMISHTAAKLLDTRKTTPNFRIPEKWAVKIGGGVNHRFALYDMIMLKDNHIDFAGGITKAISDTKKYIKDKNLNIDIEVETRNIGEVKEVLESGPGVKRILLDNMNESQLIEAVRVIGDQCETEASGGITEKNIVSIAETGVNYISVGALTHSATSLDMSLKAF